MRRGLLGLAAAGLALTMAADASACCHKKKAQCAPAPVACAPAPVAVCEAPVKKHHKKFNMPKLGCHKKKAECAPVAYTVAHEVVWATAPSAQSYAAPQTAAPQTMPNVPTK